MNETISLPALVSAHAMSAKGQNRTFSRLALYVRS